MRQFVQEEVTELTGKGTVGNDYLFEAFFIPFFSKTLLKPLVREVAEESIQGIYIGEVIEDMVAAEAEKQTKLISAVALYEEKAREAEMLFNVEAEKNFYD